MPWPVSLHADADVAVGAIERDLDLATRGVNLTALPSEVPRRSAGGAWGSPRPGRAGSITRLTRVRRCSTRAAPVDGRRSRRRDRRAAWSRRSLPATMRETSSRSSMSWAWARVLRSMLARARGGLVAGRAGPSAASAPSRDRGERRAQLVGERGQELVLGRLAPRPPLQARVVDGDRGTVGEGHGRGRDRRGRSGAPTRAMKDSVPIARPRATSGTTIWRAGGAAAQLQALQPRGADVRHQRLARLDPLEERSSAAAPAGRQPLLASAMRTRSASARRRAAAGRRRARRGGRGTSRRRLVPRGARDCRGSRRSSEEDSRSLALARSARAERRPRLGARRLLGRQEPVALPASRCGR